MRGVAKRRMVAVGVVAVVASLAWTITHPSILSKVTDDPGSLGPFLVPLVAFGVLYGAGLILMLVQVGRHMTTRIMGPGPRDMPIWSTSTIRQVGGHRLFRLGFALNWVGALGSAVVPAIAVLRLLPPSTWGVLAVSAGNVAATMAMRIPINRLIRAHDYASTAV